MTDNDEQWRDPRSGLPFPLAFAGICLVAAGITLLVEAINALLGLACLLTGSAATLAAALLFRRRRRSE